eukprot:scaffold54190_cov20-Tisochrysis_lutea.AAC.6
MRKEEGLAPFVRIWRAPLNKDQEQRSCCWEGNHKREKDSVSQHAHMLAWTCTQKKARADTHASHARTRGQYKVGTPLQENRHIQVRKRPIGCGRCCFCAGALPQR